MSTHRIDRLITTADEAVARIKDGMTVACGGFAGSAHPEALTSALERRFLSSGTPEGLTLVYGAGQGDRGSKGLNHLGHKGLIRRVIGGHYGLAPKIGALVFANQVEAYNFPQGVVCQLYRDIAAGRPGCITHVGLGTFIDPLFGGGRLNSCTTEPLIERVELAGRTWLFYKALPIDVALIRGTSADPFGNICMTDETLVGEVLAMAQAAHNSGGIVLAQVKRIADHPIKPAHVRVPGTLIDAIVVASGDEHDQTYAEVWNETYTNPASNDPTAASFPLLEPMPLDERRIIASRACDELSSGAIANLGIGMPEGVARMAAERGLLNHVTLTVESGPIGGMPAGGLSFGASVHPEAIIDQPSQFDFYDGGGLDYAALGAAQVDRHGNVNVSRFDSRLAGVGGFVNISQNAKQVVFCGTLTSSGLLVAVERGQLRIVREGAKRKFLDHVEQLSFSGQVAREMKRKVMYVTERAVFQLNDEGLELIEVAPGIDIETQILSQMDFRPIIRNVKPMPDTAFAQGPTNLKRSIAPTA